MAELTRLLNWYQRYVGGPIRWLELQSLRIMGARFTIGVLTVCVFFMTIGVWDLTIPARDGLIIIGVAGVVVGIGSMIIGCTYEHLRWMGFVLTTYGVAGIISSISHGLDQTDGAINFLQSDHFAWVWAVVTFFGFRLMVFPSHARMTAMHTLADIHAAGAQAEIEIRRKD